MKEQLILITAGGGLLTFILTVIFSRIIIPILKSHKMGQKILDIGPRWHKSKEGTPTMGGIAFIFAMTIAVTLIVIAVSVLMGRVPVMLTATFVYALSCALIGCIDDSAKLRKKQNEGLTALQKIVLQFVTAGAYTAALVYFGCIGDTLYIPFFDISTGHLGIVYYLFIVFMLVGIDNSVNLADGIDGLASSETFVVSAFFIVSGFVKYGTHFEDFYTAVGDEAMAYMQLILLGGCMAGATLGFLVYNFHPARVFMGDTGSLFLGALVMGGALMLDNPLIVILYGIMYIIESVSDIIQVGVYKLTHKRVFKMAPIHHHFEKCGWGEIKIVAVFSFVTAIFSAIAYFGLK